jgi:hypothetical protein
MVGTSKSGRKQGSKNVLKVEETEKYNIPEMMYIIEHWKELGDKVGKAFVNGEIVENEAFQTIMTNIFSTIKSNETLFPIGERKVIYKRGPLGYGRLLTKNFGYINMARPIRQTLASDLYIDIDVVNCHPVIYEYICKKYDVKQEILTHYINNREQLFTELMELNPSESKDNIKKLILARLNGGAYPGNSEINESKFSLDFYNEIQKVSKQLSIKIQQEYPTIRPYIEERERNKEKNKEKKANKDVWNLDCKIVCKILEKYEDEIRAELVNLLQDDEIDASVHCYDGVMSYVRENKKEITDDYLRFLEQSIYKKVNIPIKLKIKHFDEKLNLPDFTYTYEDFKRIKSQIQDIDDEKVARDFIKLLGNKVVKHNKQIYFFDDLTGMWEQSTDETIYKYASMYKEQLIYTRYDEEGNEKKINYGGNNTKINAIKKFFNAMVPEKERFIINGLIKSRHMLLFQDGIYNFEKDEFTYGFNPEYVFLRNIRRKFPKKKDIEKMNWIKRTLFLKPFSVSGKVDYDIKEIENCKVEYTKTDREHFLNTKSDEEKQQYKDENGHWDDNKIDSELDKNSNIDKVKLEDIRKLRTGLYLLKNIALGIAGYYSEKRFLFCVGDSNSGKGVITEALCNSFGGYVKTFNGNNLLYTKNTADEAKKLHWMCDLEGTRLIISNEATVSDGTNKLAIDANLLKKITGGGDIIEARKNRQDQYEIIPQAIPIFLCNDVPNVYPAEDDGIRTRCKYMKFERVFSSECPLDSNNNYIEETGISPKRDDVKINFLEDEYKDAFINLIIDEFRNIYVNNSIKIIEPKSITDYTKEWQTSTSHEDGSFEDVFNSNFEKTGNSNDKVKTKVIQGVFQTFGLSSVKLAEKLKKKFLINNKREASGVVWLGIKKKPREEDF